MGEMRVGANDHDAQRRAEMAWDSGYTEEMAKKNRLYNYEWATQVVK